MLSNSKHSGVPEDSKSPTLEVLGFTPTLGQSGVATMGYTTMGLPLPWFAVQLPGCLVGRPMAHVYYGLNYC